MHSDGFNSILVKLDRMRKENKLNDRSEKSSIVADAEIESTTLIIMTKYNKAI